MTSTESDTRSAVIDERTVFDTMAVERLVSHWDALRQGRAAPKRGDVDPLDLFEFLPNISMIKVIDGGREFEFSLIGTGLAKLYGLVTRQTVSEVDCAPETREALMDALKLCVETRKPVHGIWEKTRTAKLVAISLEVVFLPISEDGDEISRILGYHAVLY